MRAAGSLARGLRRRGANPASDSNARAIHADMVPPGSRTPSDRPPERRAPGQFGLESPLRYLFLALLSQNGPDDNVRVVIRSIHTESDLTRCREGLRECLSPSPGRTSGCPGSIP